MWRVVRKGRTTKLAHRRTVTVWRIGAPVLLVGLVVGCSAPTRQQVLSVLVDGVVQDTAPPRRRVRRDLLREIEELKRELERARAGAEASGGGGAAGGAVLPVEEAKSWSEAVELLPTGPDGDVDFAQALRDGTIAPRAGPGPDAEAEAVFQMDVERVPSDGDMFKVIFSHEAHTEWLACPSCHPALFQMQAGATPMSMDQINAGELCGTCHGTVAFPATACGRCHPGMA